MCRKSGSFSPISYRWLKKSYFGMFYVRTTLGCISIIIADAFICALVSWVTLSRILCTHDRYNAGGLLDNVSINIITIITIIIIIMSFAVTRLYSYMEYYDPTDLLKQIVTSFFISSGSIAMLGYFTTGITFLDLGFVAPLATTYISLFAFRYFLFFAV